MEIHKYRNLDNELINEFCDLFSEGYSSNTFIYGYLMDGNEKLIQRYMKMIVEFNNHYADYYAMRNADGKMVAGIIYLPVGCQPLGVASVVKRGKLLMLLKSILSQPIKCTKRILDFSNEEQKSWGKESFVFLENVASIEKGCGKLLIESTIENYNGQNVALNSSVSKDGHSYYNQFGFEARKEILIDGYKTVMMVRKG